MGIKVMDIERLYEHWFYHNMLTGSTPPRILLRPQIGGAPSNCTNKGKEMVVRRNLGREGIPSPVKLPEEEHPVGRNLLRMPSSPPHPGSEEKAAHEEVRPPKSSDAKVRHLCSNLERAISFSPSGRNRQHPSSKSKVQGANPTIRVENINRYVKVDHESCIRAFQMKKWKSQSDLEFEEVQGFRDLGFVFDDKEGLNPSVMKVIPGLRDRRRRPAAEEEDRKNVRRPYLSEAWLVQRSAPPMLDWVDRRSAGDMKEKLRFWARAVASNVRQEC